MRMPQNHIDKSAGKMLPYDITRPQWVKRLTLLVMKVKCSGLTHWGRATYICVSKLTIIASDNGLSPDRCQAIIWYNAGILSIGLLGTNFGEILIDILTFSALESVVCEMWAILSRPQCVNYHSISKIPTLSIGTLHWYNLSWQWLILV